MFDFPLPVFVCFLSLFLCIPVLNLFKSNKFFLYFSLDHLVFLCLFPGPRVPSVFLAWFFVASGSSWVLSVVLRRSFVCLALIAFMLYSIFTLLLTPFWSLPSPEKKIKLFTFLMLRCVLQLIANFVCLPFVALKWIYQSCFSEKSFLLWLKTVDESTETC